MFPGSLRCRAFVRYLGLLELVCGFCGRGDERSSGRRHRALDAGKDAQHPRWSSESPALTRIRQLTPHPDCNCEAVI